MSALVLIIGTLLLLTCNPIGILWGGLMVLVSLPLCIGQLFDYFWGILVAMFTLDIATLFQLIKDGVILVAVFLLILVLVTYLTGGQNGKHR